MHRNVLGLFWPFLILGGLLLAGCKAEPVPQSSSSSSSTSNSSSSSSTSSSSSSSSGSSSSSTGKAAGINHKFYVGNVTQGLTVNENFKEFWSQIAPEGEGIWASVERNRNEYNWQYLDRSYNYAKQNGLLFLQYKLVWGAEHRAWITSLSKEEIAYEYEEWIREFCTRYPQADIIEAVSEALPGHQPAFDAQKAFGANWIARVFQLARTYCPNSVLILSDYNIVRWDTNKFIALAKPLAEQGLLDGIGVEGHLMEEFSALQIQTDLDTLWNELHVPIYISEYEVALTNDEKQLEVFQRQFPVLYQHPHVKGITLYGYLYGKTVYNGAWLFNSDGTPRPAMTWLMDFIKQNPK